MLRLKEVEKKLAEIQRIKEQNANTELYRLYVEHLKSIEVAYRKEKIKALLRDIDDQGDYPDYSELRPKGIYA